MRAYGHIYARILCGNIYVPAYGLTGKNIIYPEYCLIYAHIIKKFEQFEDLNLN